MLGLLAAGAASCAFLWVGRAGEADETGDTAPAGISYAHREYLLLVAAVSILMPHLTGLSLFHWSLLRRTADESLRNAAFKAASSVAMLLLLLVLSAAAAAAFWLSCRNAGWRPSHWLAKPAGAVATAHPTPERRLPLMWAKRFLLSWRLPLFYGWLLVVAGLCSFLGWWGFLATVPAALLYIWLLMRERAPHRGAA